MGLSDLIIPQWAKLLGAAVVCAGVFAGGMWLEAKFKDVEIAGLHTAIANKQASDTTASLNQLKTFISTMQAAASGYQGDQQALFSRLDQLHKDFINASRLKPLPADCRPDADRLHILSTSVAAANAAAAGRQPSSPMPSNP